MIITKQKEFVMVTISHIVQKVIDEKIDMELKMILQHTPVYKRRT